MNNSQQRHFETTSFHSNIANILDRTPVCTLIASLVSEGKMCRARFVQLFIVNVLDRTHVCKVRAMVFPLKSRENPQHRICASLQRKRLFWMTRVQPCTNNLVRFFNPYNTAIWQNMQLKITNTI